MFRRQACADLRSSIVVYAFKFKCLFCDHALRVVLNFAPLPRFNFTNTEGTQLLMLGAARSRCVTRDTWRHGGMVRDGR